MEKSPTFWLRTAGWLLCSVLVAPNTALAIPGDILFSDDFERAALAPWTTTDSSRSGILTGVDVSGSPTRGGYTRNDPVSVTSPDINAAVPAAEFSFWVRRGADAFSEDTDGGEDLVIEYRRADNSWSALVTYLGSGINGEIITDTIILPPDALHGTLAIRFRQTNGSGVDFDYWHFDDTVVTEIVPPPSFGVGSCDDFEAGLAGNWTINAGSGFAGTSSATSQSPTSSMFTNGGVVEVTMNPIDTTDPSFSDLTMWIRRGSDAFSEDPDGGEDFVVEYLDDVGGWIQLETFTGPGAGGEIFPRSYFLPAAGRHTNFQLRFRQTGGSGSPWDFWHVDDVCFETQVLPTLNLTKTEQTISDPINGTTNPFAIPGAVKEYTISLVNSGPGTVDAGTLVITDVVPANTALFVDTGSGDPIVFIDGPIASGLAYSYAADVTFSDQPGGGAPFTYVPTPDANGYDAAVTGMRIAPTGTMNASGGGGDPSFEITFRVRVD